MKALRIVLGIAAALVVLILLVTLGCFFLAFYAPRRKPKNTGEFDLPAGKIYKPHYGTMTAWMKEVRGLPHEEMTITSFDGLTLHGKYYEYAPGAPVELMVHGYRGTAERDLCGGIQRCFALGHSALLVDQRTSGKSGGRVITFGAKESRDCRAWVDYMIERFGPDVRIILTGISMGAATVLITAGKPLPKNVVGALADCGYTSGEEIIKKVIRQMKLPPSLMYPFVKLGARLFGRFDVDEASPIEAMKTCQIPVIFIHGEDDAFVPCEMSVRNYEACTAPKALLTVPGAGHGLSYVVDGDAYLNALREFWARQGQDVPEKTV